MTTMSVEVISPSLPGPSNLGVNGLNGTNGYSNGGDHDSTMVDGSAEAGSKFPTGMILPPPDMRSRHLILVHTRFDGSLFLFVIAIINSTAGFVASSANPVQFETKIRENHRQDPKFSFLNPADPYHAYYRYRIERVKNGEVDNDTEKESAAKDEVKIVAEVDATPKEPPPLEFVLPVPHKSALDL